MLATGALGQGRRQASPAPPPLPLPSGASHLPLPRQPPSPRPTDKADLCFLGAASLQLPQLLADQALYGGHPPLPLQWVWQESQQVLPRTQQVSQGWAYSRCSVNEPVATVGETGDPDTSEARSPPLRSWGWGGQVHTASTAPGPSG